MTAQSASKLGSLASSLRSTASASYRIGSDLLFVAVVALVVMAVTIPVVHHIYVFWHQTVTATGFWQNLPPAPQKATVKRASP